MILGWIFGVIQKLLYIVLYGISYYSYKFRCILSPDEGEYPVAYNSGKGRCSSTFRYYWNGHPIIYESASCTPPEQVITIAVDSTPDRCGGLLILPKQKRIYFYSLEWPSSLRFPSQPDKFEMLNAYLALLLFEGRVASYRLQYGDDELILKCDNNFCQNPTDVYRGKKNVKWRELFLKVNSKLGSDPFQGNWQYERWDDPSIIMADKLSRYDCSKYSTLPKIRIGNPDIFNCYPTATTPFYPKYSNVNISLRKGSNMKMCDLASQVQRLELSEMFKLGNIVED